MAIRYLSEEWAQEALRVIETDPEVRAALRGTPLSLLTIVLQPPEGCYGFVYAAFDEDGLSEYRVGHDYHAVTEGLAAPTFVVSGHYDTFADIQARRLQPRKAIMQGRLHLTGPWRLAVRRMKALETLTAALCSIDATT